MTIPITFHLESARLHFLLPSKKDVPFIFEAFHSDGFLDGMTFEPPETHEEIEASLDTIYDNWHKGYAYAFSLYAKQSSAFVGRVGIRQTDTEGTWVIFYYIHPNHQKQGYATEAAQNILKFGFEELNASHIEAFHADFNQASQRTLEKIGMKFVEHIPESFQKKGRWIGDNHFSLSKVMWHQQEKAS